MPNRLDQTEVFVKVNSRQIVSSDQLHLNLDVAALKDGVPVPQQSVFLEVGNSKKIVQTNENGIAENQVVIFEFIYGTRLKLLAWANELQKSAYDVSPDGYEEKIREEIIEKERKENLLRKREELEKLKQEFESTKEEEVKRRLKKKMQEIKEEMEQDEAQRKDTIRKLLEDQKALGLLKEKTDAERQSFQKEIDELKTKLEQQTDIIRQAVRAEIDELKQKVIALTPRPLSNEKLTEDEREEFQLVVKAGEEKLLDKNVYEVKKDIIVEEGGKLIIQPGAELHFEPAAGIVCYGQLIAEGTEELPIIFREAHQQKSHNQKKYSVETLPGTHWKNITLFGEGANNSSLMHCQIINGGGRQYILDEGKIFIKPENLSNHTYKQVQSRGGGISLLFCGNTTIDHVRVHGCQVERNGTGAGIYAQSSSLHLNHCTLDNNAVEKFDGTSSSSVTLYMSNGEMFLSECAIIANDCGGIRAHGQISIKKTKIRKNKGVGARLEGGNHTTAKSEIKECEISSNEGGGMQVIGAEVFVSSSKIESNTSKDKGGGIYAESGVVIVEGTKIRKNHANKYGGGVYIASAKGIMDECEICENEASIGGGISLEKHSDVRMNNSNIERNKAQKNGSGIYMFAKGETKTSRTIKQHLFSKDEVIITMQPSYSLSPLQVHNSSVILNEGGAAVYIVGPHDELSLYRKRTDSIMKEINCTCGNPDCWRNSNARTETKEYEAARVEEEIFGKTVLPQAVKQILFYLSHYQKVCGLRIEGNLDENLRIGEKIE